MQEKNRSRTVYASRARVYHYDLSSGWSVPEEEVTAALEGDMDEVGQGRLDLVHVL